MQTTFSLEDLAHLTSYSKRTIRYYVQLGLVDRPIGEGRGAHYTTDHLRELLDIRKLTENGLSLEAVKHHLRQENLGVKGGFARKPGTIQVQSRVCLAPGLDLLVSPDESTLSPDDIRSLIRNILELTRRYSDGPARQLDPGLLSEPAGLGRPGQAPPDVRMGAASGPGSWPPEGGRRN
ncbi:MAG: helix-turn-helix domain-containing protein [Deltaproteobacteria bacterium]|jgi:DNA-binding transcriptional MerR regulator|nr:helix-turn-helix domain-containing protein [Deltaproteobacteria bacterium]